MDTKPETLRWTEEDLDLMTLIEPLACVQHAYRRLPETLKVATACVWGGGPIGSLHVIELQKRFPGVRVEVIDSSALRRNLLATVFPDVPVKAQVTPGALFDLTIVATSDPQANLDALHHTKAMGHVVHFSGLNHKTKDELVTFEGIDIERVHRNEEIRCLSNGTRILGSSGYSEADIERSILSLINAPSTYRRIQTGIVADVDSKILFHSLLEKVEIHQEPVVEKLFADSDAFMNHLKVVFRVRSGGGSLKVSPALEQGGYRARVKPNQLSTEVQPGYVRVQMLRFSICNTDRRVLQGTKAAVITEDLVLGHEGVGRVIARGEGVADSAEGLSLVLPHYYIKSDPFLRNGIPYLSPRLLHLGVHIDGCFADVIDVPVSCVFAVESVLLQAVLS